MRSGQDEDERIRPIGNGCTDAPFNGIASLDYTRKRDLLNLSKLCRALKSAIKESKRVGRLDCDCLLLCQKIGIGTFKVRDLPILKGPDASGDLFHQIVIVRNQ
jgi:hypothetical protein